MAPVNAGKTPPRRRGVGAQASPASSGVVSIRAHASYRPGYASVASGHVVAARQKLGLTHAEFADYLSDELGWPVYESAVKRWESSKAPPGDAVIACMGVTHGDPGLPAPLLAAVPPAFPAAALAGYWVTTYQFTHAGKLHYHADIAHVTAESGSRIRVVNHPPEPRSEGRASAFRNEIAAALAGRHLIGEWQNLSDTRYCGSLQLAVLPGETVMEGYYTGVGSDVEVSTGAWKWVRLIPPPDTDLAGITLRDPAGLYEMVMGHTQNDSPLTLAEVRGDT
jgi:hypothetical protein